MAYTPTFWQSGDAITLSRINKLEQGLATASFVDTTLTALGVAADSMAVGDKIAEVRGLITNKAEELSEDIGTMNEYLSTLNINIGNETSNREAADATLAARIDNFANRVTTVNSELIDIRTKADGTTSTSAGNAIREQYTELKSVMAALKEHLIGVKNALESDNTTSAIAMLDQCVLDLDVLG